MFYLIDTTITVRKQTRVEADTVDKAIELAKTGKGIVVSQNGTETNNGVIDRNQKPAEEAPKG